MERMDEWVSKSEKTKKQNGGNEEEFICRFCWLLEEMYL